MTFETLQEIYFISSMLSLCMGFSVGCLFWKGVLK